MAISPDSSVVILRGWFQDDDDDDDDDDVCVCVC